MKPYPWDSHDIGVTYIGKVWEIYFPPIILPLTSIIGLGFRLHINVFVMNYGAYSKVFNVTVYANTTIIDTITNITLASRNSVILNFTWDTTDVTKGNCTISAVADTVQGETDTTDNIYTDGWVVVTIPGDVNGDYYVEMMDYWVLSQAYGSQPEDPNWNPNADIWEPPDGDGIIEMMDYWVISQHYGECDP
jgi:hypothetical protein